MGAVAVIQKAKQSAIRSKVPHVIYQERGAEPAYMPADWAEALLGSNKLTHGGDTQVIGFVLPNGRFNGQYLSSSR